jgi:flavodoxin
MNCRANREQNDPTARPEIANEINLDGYDKVYLGYPIWWNTLPKIINTFVETHALDSKEIVAFCTSGSSSIDTSISALKEYGLNIIDSKRIEADASESNIESWLGL